MTGPAKHKVPIEQLLSAIEETLKAAPRLVDQLAFELGYTASAVRPRLEQLEREHRAHRVRVKREHSQGLCHQWRYGQAPGVVLAPAIVLAQALPRAELRVVVPFQAIVRSWPAFCCRDPLVAAFFGPVGQAGRECPA